MQYENGGVNRPIYYDINVDVMIYETESTVNVDRLGIDRKIMDLKYDQNSTNEQEVKGMINTYMETK